MKSNFTLYPSNVGVFKKRLLALLGKTGVVDIQSFYTGRKSGATLLTKAGVKHDLQQITKTQVSSLLRSKVRFDSYGKGEGIIVRIHNDSNDVILFGAKIKFTSNGFTILSGNNTKFDLKYRSGSITKYRIGHALKQAEDQVHWEEKMAEMYWKDVEADLLADFDNFFEHEDF